jgi:hypothetical protein
MYTCTYLYMSMIYIISRFVCGCSEFCLSIFILFDSVESRTRAAKALENLILGKGKRPEGGEAASSDFKARRDCERALCIDEIRRLRGIPAIVDLISLPAPNQTSQTSKRGKRSAIEIIAVLSKDERNGTIICEHRGVRNLFHCLCMMDDTDSNAEGTYLPTLSIRTLSSQLS